jgi:hypothetical protein
MVNGSSVASILGYGAIGLGFLLALLAYRLLGKPGIKERPIYVFEVFCLVLVLVGAFLQYSDGQRRVDASTHETDALRAQNSRLAEAMNSFVNDASTSIADLQPVGNFLTSAACSGSAHGDPIQGGAGQANVITKVVNRLAASKATLAGLQSQ